MYSSPVRDFHNFQIVWGKQVKSLLLMMENSIVKTKLSNFTFKYLPNQSTFYLVNGKNVDFFFGRISAIFCL